MNIPDFAKFPLLSLQLDGFDHRSPFPNQSCNKEGSPSAPVFGAFRIVPEGALNLFLMAWLNHIWRDVMGIVYI